ncbi:MAG TPA: DMT family transporter [Candidatus Competibacteraceae bacterium]|nr:DMT family transporter [Candidatus Competibacteraceae bacterium]
MATARAHSLWLSITPALFVVLWSTGFIGAKLGLPHAEPFTFLTLRFIIATALLLVFALATRAPWPRSWGEAGRIALAGLLVHAVYLGGVFSAIGAGLSPGVAALIVGIQPLLTAAVAGWWLAERVTGRQWAGLALGLLGVVLVVSSRLGQGGTNGFGLAAAVVALFGITLGTLYQKRHCAGMDLRSGGVIQYAVTGLAMLSGAGLFETRQVAWSGEFVFALLWLVLVLSVGAVGLLYTLIRRGEAARVASLFYLTPPTTALLAFLVFGERLPGTALAGMAVVVLGVWLVNAPRRG